MLFVVVGGIGSVVYDGCRDVVWTVRGAGDLGHLWGWVQGGVCEEVWEGIREGWGAGAREHEDCEECV